MSRHVRVETRSRHQNDLKRVMHSTAKVRKWEKKWVRIEETSLQIFKWMPIKTEETLQPDTPLQQQLVADNQEFDKRKENMENVDLRNVKSNCIDSITTNNTSVTNGSSTLQAGPASTNTLDNRLLDHNMLNGSNNSVNHVQQDGMVQQIIPVSSSNMNKHPLESDNDESFFESAVDFPASKRLRTMPSDTSFIGLNIRQSQTVPVLSSEVKVIDDIETSMSNSSATVFSQMKPSSSVQAAMLHEQTSTVSHLIQTGSNQTSTATSSSSSSPSPMMISEGKLTNLSPTDIEMMDTDMAVDDCTNNISPVREQELNKLVPTSTKTMIDLEDFSDIARIVTEQIVTKVSDCHGNLLRLQDGK